MLAYKFVAQFSDWTSFEQNDEDQSRIDPSKSSFFDLLALVDQGKEITTFSLYGQGHCIRVCLDDGHFEVDGSRVYVGDEIPPPGTKLKLIYFRRNQIHFNVDYQEQGRSTRYIVGWEAIVDGRKLKALLGVF